MSSYYEKFLATGEVKCIDEEIPFEIPKGWEWVRLSHVTDIARGGSPRPIKEFLTDSIDGINWIKIGDTEKDGKYINAAKERIKKEGVSKSRMVHKGDFLLTNSMSFGRPYITNINGCVHDGWLVISPILNSFNQDFLYNLLSSQFAYMQFAGKVSGAVVQNLNSEKVAMALFPFPSYAEQVRIVKKINKLIPHVEKYSETEKVLKTLDTIIFPKLKKSILQEAIQGRLVTQIAEEGTAWELLEQIRQEKQKLVKEGKLKKTALTDSIIYKGDDNKYYENDGNNVVCIDDEIPFEIPNSWCWMRLNNLCRITNGFTPLRTEPKFWENGTISWFTVEDIHKQGEYIYQTSQRITNLAVSNDRIVRAGSILLCCTASVGQCAMTMIPITTNQQFNALTIKDEYRCLVNDDFLYLFAKTLEPILHDLAGKTTFEFISVKKVGNILIPIPPVLEQHRICEVTNKAIASIMSR